jgi:hypothetical protein
MAFELPPTEADLRSVTAFADQVVARGLMSATSVEIETIRRLVRGQRVHERNSSSRLAYLRESGLGYFTDEILSSARAIAEEIAADPKAAAERGLLLARVVLGDRAALDAFADMTQTTKVPKLDTTEAP